MAYIQLLLLFIISIIFNNFIQYYTCFLELDLKKQNYKSVTVSNYSIELKITDNMWENFLNKINSNNNEESTNINKLFIEELKNQIDYCLSIYKCGDDDDLDVAAINLAFKNNSLINLLAKRGHMLTIERNVTKKCMLKMD